ncbi:hypothetical protein WDW86_10655 [Bdellovibrionota bacterium FG-2]
MKMNRSVIVCLVALGIQGPPFSAFATAPKESCRLQATLQVERSLIESTDSPLFVEVTFRFRAETPYARVIEKKLLTLQPSSSAQPGGPAESSFVVLPLDVQIGSVLYERSLQDVLVSVFPSQNTQTGFPVQVERFLPERIQQGESPKDGSALVCTQWAS